MSGRRAVHSMRCRLAATFERANGAGGDAELLSDLARYLCVLVSGYLEQAVIELAMEHVRRRSDPSVQSFVDARLKSFTNANSTRLIDLLGSFSADWRNDMDKYLIDELKDAVNSVVSLRHAIAHGRHVGVTISRARDYFRRVDSVIKHIAELCAPSDS